jgi:branched-chain amino acid transport system substrate-binding protein
MKKILFSVMLIIALVTFFVFPSAQAAEKTLVIGGIAFLTGPAAAGGMACKAGWELAVAKYNKAGGIKIGGDTYKIKLIVEDDAMSLDQAITVATKLIKSDGAKVVVGPLIDAFKNAIYPITSKAGVQYASIDTCNASRVVKYKGNTDVGPERPLYIRGHWANDEITPYLLDYLKANYPKAKKVAVCGVTEECSVGLYNWFEGIAKSKGLQRVGQLEQMAPDTSDYHPPVTRILSSKPDAIWVAMSTPVTWAFVLKAAREQGFKGPIFCSTHLDVSFTDMVAGGKNTDIFGVGITLNDMGPLSKDLKDARELYKSLGYSAKDEIADIYLVGYNGLWVLLQAIEKAGSLDAAVITKTYEGLTKKGDLMTLWGPAYVGGKKATGVNRVLCEPYWIDSCKNGVSKNEKLVFVAVP